MGSTHPPSSLAGALLSAALRLTNDPGTRFRAHFRKARHGPNFESLDAIFVAAPDTSPTGSGISTRYTVRKRVCKTARLPTTGIYRHCQPALGEQQHASSAFHANPTYRWIV